MTPTTTAKITIAQALARFVPAGRQSQLLYAFKNKLNQEESELVQRAIWEAMLVPLHEASLVSFQ